MSEPEDAPENFLQRWSRRKQTEERRAAEKAAQQTSADARAPDRTTAKVELDLPAFDPESLPPIDSINAASDIRAFLAPGVPEELRRAALRRAWVTDPTIRDFVGLAENQWDFTNPDAVPGFGRLDLTDAARRMAARVLGRSPNENASGPPRSDWQQSVQNAEKPGEMTPPERSAEPERETSEAELIPVSENLGVAPGPLKSASPVSALVTEYDDAAQKSSEAERQTPPTAHRRHGGAIPK